MPVRLIPTNRRSITGFLHSQKQGRMIAYESTLERDVFTLAEFHPRVASFEEQPIPSPIRLLMTRRSEYSAP